MLMLIWNNIARRRTQSVITVTITTLTIFVFVMGADCAHFSFLE